ncbi:MAG TPA: hypothetical protein VLG12_03795 [Candidatus Saccharimonadales bacterium]|nr:hypothetical protein [Candidatus Saccharimonadales bacterium]
MEEEYRSEVEVTDHVVCPYCLTAKDKGNVGMGIFSFICRKHREKAATDMGVTPEQLDHILEELKKPVSCPGCGEETEKYTFCLCGRYING